MAKTDQIFRLIFIAEFFKRNPKGFTYAEIKNYLERKFEEKKYDLQFSQKSFKRDRLHLLEILEMETDYDLNTRKYQIIDDFEVDSENIFDTILLIDAYKQTKGNSEIMLFEKRKARGLDHLHGILHAIQNRKIISFNYSRFYEDEPERCVVKPFALKEFKYRWYLLAKYNKSENQNLKIFALDRISELELSASTFTKEKLNVEEVFKNSFGIFTTFNEKPVEIVLSFTAFQGKYIKTLPLHHSQEILIDNENELKIKLILVPTYDFVQEILSLGDTVKVISPESFRQEIVVKIEEMKENYL